MGDQGPTKKENVHQGEGEEEEARSGVKVDRDIIVWGIVDERLGPNTF